MTRFLMVLVLATMATGCVAPMSSDVFVDQDVIGDREAWTVAVFDFEYQGEEDGQMGTLSIRDGGGNAGASVASIFSTSLARIPSIKIVERSRLDTLFDEQERQSSRMMSQSDAVELGRLAGADAVCLGHVTKYTHWKDLFAAGTTVGFTMRIVDVESGLVMMSGSVNNVGVNLELTPNTQVCAKEMASKLQAELGKKKS